MTTITIPKKVTFGKELVAIPREEYEEFFQWRKTMRAFKPTLAQLKDLKRAREDYKKGRYISIYELKRQLGIKN